MRNPNRAKEQAILKAEVQRLRSLGVPYREIGKRLYICQHTAIRLNRDAGDTHVYGYGSSMLLNKEFWQTHPNQSILDLSFETELSPKTVRRWKKEAYRRWPELGEN